MENERKILKEALEQFEKLTGLKADTEWNVGNNDKGIDAIITIPKLKFKLYAEVKLNITNQTMGGIVHRLKDSYAGDKVILITRYVTPQLADRLKELKVFFLDTAGNIYINIPEMLLFVKGNKTKMPPPEEKPVRAFQPAGLQLIYALLCNPGLENKPYRTMAEKANIANGAVAFAIKDLKKLEYLIDMGEKGRKLKNKKELLQRWVNQYAELLRPKLFEGRYKIEDKDWWKNQDITKYNAKLGGETAAALLTKYLKPEDHIIYIDDNKGNIVLQLKLKNDPKGNVELLKKFWNFNNANEENNIVNPILVYADLLATGNNRNIETAKIIYEQEIIQYIRED